MKSFRLRSIIRSEPAALGFGLFLFFPAFAAWEAGTAAWPGRLLSFGG